MAAAQASVLDLPLVMGVPVTAVQSAAPRRGAGSDGQHGPPVAGFVLEIPLEPVFMPEQAPVMLPSYAFQGHLDTPVEPSESRWILVPGPSGNPKRVRGTGAVRAGMHHKPRGSAGLLAGAAAGVALGGLPVLVLPGLGYLAAKKLSRARHTIRMKDKEGQLVEVKLWKPGKYAPLTEDGYWLVASDPRPSEMASFARRVLARMGGFSELPELHAFAVQHATLPGLSSLAKMREELTAAPWVHFS